MIESNEAVSPDDLSHQRLKELEGSFIGFLEDGNDPTRARRHAGILNWMLFETDLRDRREVVDLHGGIMGKGVRQVQWYQVEDVRGQIAPKGYSLKMRNIYRDLLAPIHRRKARREVERLEGLFKERHERFFIPFAFRGKGHFRSICPKQNIWEIQTLYTELLKIRPRNVLEIGTGNGGTLYLWTQASHAQARIVSLDLPGGAFGGGYPICRVPFYRSFARGAQGVFPILGDSHRPEIKERIMTLFGGEGLDMLYIDGDHTYEGVRMDYMDYSPMVRPGGLIAFHDILPRVDDPGNEVAEFWRDLKGGVRSAKEIVAPFDFVRRIGIGCIYAQ